MDNLRQHIIEKSTLVQGGLELRCKVILRIPATVKNYMLVNKNVELVEHTFTEPKEEVIFGYFLARVE